MDNDSDSPHSSKKKTTFRDKCVDRKSFNTFSSKVMVVLQKKKGILALPSAVTCEHVLHFCKRERILDHAHRLHAYLQGVGLDGHCMLGNCLISLLVELGKVHEAEQIYLKSNYGYNFWSDSLIIGYVKNEMFQQAIMLYKRLREDESYSPNDFTLMALFKTCTLTRDLEMVFQIHADTIKQGLLDINIFIGCALLHLYAICGLLANAQQVFTNLSHPNIVSWNTLIAGYAEHGHAEKVLCSFDQMQLLGTRPNAVTFVCALKACGCVEAIDKGIRIHAEVARQGFGNNLFLGNTLISMYVACGRLEKAKEVFANLQNRDIVSWNALITGYAEHGFNEAALSSFMQMQGEGIHPNTTTYVSALKACAASANIDKGEEIHYDIAKGGLGNDLYIGSTLVDMYAKCNVLSKAQEVFNKLPGRDTISWNALISGYAEHGCGEEALNCCKQMQLENVLPDNVTYTAILKACGLLRDLHKGQEFHAEVARNGLEQDSAVASSLVDMYGKCGFLEKAQELVDTFSFQSPALWTALIGGYADCGDGEEALNSFQKMQMEGLSPNAVTYICILKACGSIGTSHKGQEIHLDLARQGLESDVVIGSTLIDMYGKCCLVAKAQEVFDKLPARNAVSWNALIAGYAQVGDNERVFHTFDMMVMEGEKPNEGTFLSLLTTCCHAGLLEKGQAFFASMTTDFDLTASLEHVSCIIDLLGRAGQLGKAVETIKLSMSPDLGVWLTLLDACERWGDVNVGRLAFDHAMLLDEDDATVYHVSLLYMPM